MGDYGIKISLPGKDVKKATGDELGVKSQKDVFKVASGKSPSHFGSFNFNVNIQLDQHFEIKRIPHNLGYAPHIWAYFVRESDSTSGLLPYLSGDIAYYFELSAAADEKDIIFYWDTSAATVGGQEGDEVFAIRYYIFSNQPIEK